MTIDELVKWGTFGGAIVAGLTGSYTLYLKHRDENQRLAASFQVGHVSLRCSVREPHYHTFLPHVKRLKCSILGLHRVSCVVTRSVPPSPPEQKNGQFINQINRLLSWPFLPFTTRP